MAIYGGTGSGREPSWLRQQCEQHLPGDRRRDLAAGRLAAEVAAVLDDHRDREPRVVGGREGDEPRVRCLPFDAGLRGAGLARHRDAGDLRRGAGAALDDLRPSWW